MNACSVCHMPLPSGATLCRTHSLPEALPRLITPEAGRSASDPATPPVELPCSAPNETGQRAGFFSIEDHLTTAERYELAACRYADHRMGMWI